MLGHSETMDPETLKHELADLNEWTHEDNQLVKRYKFMDFTSALAFIVRVGVLAEKANHHPTLENTYNRVTLRLCTHDAGNVVTAKDIDLAKAIERS